MMMLLLGDSPQQCDAGSEDSSDLQDAVCHGCRSPDTATVSH